MLETTLKKLRKYEACEDRYVYLTATLGDEYGDDTPLSVSRILDTNGVSDALWALRACDMSQKDENAVYLLACDYAEHVLPIFENRYPGNHHPRAAIEARRAWVREEISDKELKRAADSTATYYTTHVTAYYITYADSVSASSAAFVAFAAYASATNFDAATAAGATAAGAAVATADAAARAAARAAEAAATITTATRAAARAAARAAEAEEKWQAQKLRAIL